MLQQDQHTVIVKNVQVALDRRLINAFYNLPYDIDCEYLNMVENMTAKKWSDVLKTYTVEGSSWLNEECRVVNRIDLNLVPKMCVKFLKSRLVHTTHTTMVSRERLILLYVIIKSLPINVRKIIEREIRECAMKK